MADRTQLSEAIDNAIRALEELKRVWEAQQEAAPQVSPVPAPQAQAAPVQPASAPYAAPVQPASAPVRPAPVRPAPAPYEAPAQPASAAYTAAAQPAPAQPAKPRNKFCIKCGNRLQPGDRFCMNCGAPIS